MREYGVELQPMDHIRNMDAVILAVAHEEFKLMTQSELDKLFKDDTNSKKVLVDIKGLLNRKEFEAAGYVYWRL